MSKHLTLLHDNVILPMHALREGLTKLLMVDLLVVFLFFLWFVAAVAAESMGKHLGLHLWQTLWEPVIQPALGIAMLGAIAPPAVAWVARVARSLLSGNDRP